MPQDYLTLPTDLPAPPDDGACVHLIGTSLPPIVLTATHGTPVNVGGFATPRTVLFAYPRTGQPGEPSPGGDDFWNAIPGARGCTPEVCRFRDLHAELCAHQTQVFGLSVQSPAYQGEMTERLHVPFAILSDEHLTLTRALQLPTFQVEGLTLLKRFTLIVRGGIIEHVFYPVFPTTTHAEEVLHWLQAHPLPDNQYVFD